MIMKEENMDKESKLLIGVLRRSVTGKMEPLCLDMYWQQMIMLAKPYKLLPSLSTDYIRPPKTETRFRKTRKRY